VHTRKLVGGELVRTVAEQDDVIGPLAQHDGEVLAAGAGGENGEALVAVLEAVAVRAGVRARAPQVGEAGDVGHFVEHPRREEDRPCEVRAAG
jgi:hypothetical protein